MLKSWRKYISPCLLVFEKQLFYLKLYTLIQFLKIESKEIFYGKYKLSMRYIYNNKDQLSFELYYNNILNKTQIHVLSSTLERLNMGQNPGYYWQRHIQRKTKEIFPNISFCSVFHEIIRAHRYELAFIKAVYSTSVNDIDRYSLSALG